MKIEGVMFFVIIISLILTLALCCCVSAGRAEKRERGKIKMTNFEKIKQMSVEEMAEAIQNITNSEIDVGFCQNKKECNEIIDAFCDLIEEPFDVDLPCRNCIKEWLESEVQEDE